MGENSLLANFFGINEDQKKFLVRRGNLSVAQQHRAETLHRRIPRRLTSGPKLGPKIFFWDSNRLALTPRAWSG